MPSKRSYGDPCGIARALDLVGERWALLVVRELVLGPKRFTDLRAGLENLSPDVLSQRLRDLERGGIVRRATLPPPAASRVYELTDWGRELEPVLLALGRWGSRAPFPAGHGELGTDALVLALKTTFDPAAGPGGAAGGGTGGGAGGGTGGAAGGGAGGAAGGAAGGGAASSVELRLGEQTFTARVEDGRLEIGRGGETGPGVAPEATITSDPATLTQVVFHGHPLAEAERSGALAIAGDRAAATAFLRTFAVPAAAK